MKKTTTIHLSGILFNIEEDAYQLLSEYLTSIEKHFESHSGKKEILEDIENRISEILSAKLNDSKQVITLDDIQEIINTMGKVEDFDSEQTSSNNTQTFKVNKRFYRNPDDKVLGGVCSGIAAYFDIDPLWIRLAWAILFFVFGSGLLFYILLWIIIPEAKTPSQKLEMKGEPINISNISKGIAQDFNNFGKRAAEDFGNFGRKAGKEFSKLSSNNFVLFIQNILQYFLDFIKGAGKVLFKVTAIFLILILSFVAVVMFVALFGNNVVSIDSTSFSTTSLLSDFFPSSLYEVVFMLSLFLLIGVPVFFFLIVLFKFIFNIKKRIKHLGLATLILWLIGWGLLVLSITDIASQYSEKAYTSSQLSTYVLPHQTIFIKMSDDEEYKEEEENFKIKINNKIFYKDNPNSVSIGFPAIFIRKSKDDSLRVKIVQSAIADSKKQAREFAKNVRYTLNLKDSIIELSPKYDIPKDDKFHFQRIKVIIEIPQNRYVYLSKNMKNYLTEATNNIDADEEDMVGKKWLMGIDHLQCLESCDDISNVRHKHKHRHKKKSDEDEQNDYGEETE